MTISSSIIDSTLSTTNTTDNISGSDSSTPSVDMSTSIEDILSTSQHSSPNDKDEDLTTPASPAESNPARESVSFIKSNDETETEDETGDEDVIDKSKDDQSDSKVQDKAGTLDKLEIGEEEEDDDRVSSPPKGNRDERESHSAEKNEISSENVAEMARFRAAKFIQERTKMACLLPSVAEAELAKQSNSMSAALSQSGGSVGGSRKRKLTVKDILVSQRTRDTKQQRLMNDSQSANVNNLNVLSQLMPSLGSNLDPNSHMNDPNPFAAFLAAAAANSNSSSNEANLAQAFMPDSQSAYISSLASSLSNSNTNPTTALALMASLSAIMQNSNNGNIHKDSNVDTPMNVINPLSQLTSNPLINLESTLANVMANNFSRNSTQSNNVDEDDEDEEKPNGTGTPLDFSLKTVVTTKSEEKSKKKSKKKINGENGSNEEETPLDLSAPKRSEEVSDHQSHHQHKVNDSSISPLLSQISGIDNSNGNNNFAAMAAAAAAAAFSPNLLTKMAASISPWANFGGSMANNNKTNANDSNSTAAAFAALFQQVYSNNNNNSNNNHNSNNNQSSQSAPSKSINKNSHSPQLPSVASLFQSFPDLYWNGKFQNKTSNTTPSFGGLSNSAASLSARHHHHQPPPAASQPMRTKSSSGRQNPWQAQWINRSSEQTRDVFTCVWCKDSFKSLAEMTDHMKRSPRCGMAGMQQHHSHTHHPQQQPQQHYSNAHSPAASASSNHHAQSQQPNSQSHQVSSNKVPNLSSPPMSSMKDTTNHNHQNNSLSGNLLGSSKPSGVNMPRKLVRGQDVWLGRGAEQTRQILKCMWCGQSFKSLADMTQHMKVTQHYTNIISQEQITSWRQTDDKLGEQSQLNAVLTCKVCDEAFGSLKDLSNHMLKNQHFKESVTKESRSGASTPTLQSTPNSNKGSRSPVNPSPAAIHTSSDRRKKSLPVRKLLEIERSEVPKKSDDEEGSDSQKSPKSHLIECEDCREKIEPRCYLQHIKQCRHKNSNKSDAESERGDSDKGTDDHASNADTDSKNGDEPKHEKKDTCGDDSKDNDGKGDSKVDEKTDSAAKGGENSSGGSVLNALEKLIEKNFDSKSRRTQQTGILQRLGIDEEVFPPWQNMTPNSAMSSAMSSAMAPWTVLNGNEFSRSNSSSSTNSRVNSLGIVPQLRYRRNSSNSLKKNNTESNCSFSSQETEEEESGDDSNYDYDQRIKPSNKRQRLNEKSRLNFPISSMLSSPIPARPTSASSIASSISPSEPSRALSDQLNRMTPSSHRSALEDDEDEDGDFTSPMALCKKTFEEGGDFRKTKPNGSHDDEDEDKPSHHPLLQLQKLLDKTDNSPSRKSNPSQRLSSPFAWQDSSSAKGVSPASSPMTPPIAMQHSPSSASVKSDDGSYHLLKCAFCDTQIASRGAYRSHLAKGHLQMREPVDMISDEELLLLVLAKSSNLQFGGNNNQTTSAKPARKESKRKSAKSNNWETKSPNPISNSPSPAPQIETSQSKFLKYTELAKQLSSKYV